MENSHLQIVLFGLASTLIQSCLCVGPYYGAPAAVYGYPTAPVYHAPVHAARIETIDPNPSYHFKYGVNDPSTGDYKTAEEYRKDGVVQGSYSLAEADGTIRTVHYTADGIHGFNAIVDKHSPKAIAAPIHAAAYAPAALRHHYVAPPAYRSYQPAAIPAPAYHYAAPYSYPYHK